MTKQLNSSDRVLSERFLCQRFWPFPRVGSGIHQPQPECRLEFLNVTAVNLVGQVEGRLE